MIVVRFARRRQHRHAVPSPRRLLFIGFPAAFIDALGGGGWGPIATPSLLMSNVDPAKAVGTVNAVEFFVTLTISSVFLVTLPVVDWRIAIPLAAGAAVTAPFAALVTKKMPTRALGTAVGIVIILLSARTIALASAALGVFFLGALALGRLGRGDDLRLQVRRHLLVVRDTPCGRCRGRRWPRSACCS